MKMLVLVLSSSKSHRLSTFDGVKGTTDDTIFSCSRLFV